MQEQPLLKVFTTGAGQYYAYYARTNQIITIRQRMEHEAPEAAARIITDRLLKSRSVSAAPLPGVVWQHSFEAMLDRARRGVPRLILQITRRCNLRCDYCVYSGNYEQMEPHAEEDMCEGTIRKSLDLFAARSEGCSEVIVDMYGGEALLRLDLLRLTVEYARAVLPGRTIAFRITSNGVLLNEGAGQWLAGEPDVQLTVTVNGPYHDQHRVTASGHGSLGIILDNLQRICQRYPAVWEKQIQFIANIVHPGQLLPLKAFYERYIGKPPQQITRIRGQYGNEKIRDILSEDAGPDTEEQLCSQFCQRDDPFLEAYFGQGLRAVGTRHIYPDGDAGYVGSCFPAADRLFVHCNGDLGICESACDRAIIGHVDRGLDKKALRRLYDGTARLFHDVCRHCWAQRLCTACFKDILLPDGTVRGTLPEGFCEASRDYTLEQLQMYCRIAENQPERLAHFG